MAILFSVHLLPNQCLLHLSVLRTLTFQHACPRSQLVIVLIKLAVRGLTPLLVSLATNEPTRCQLAHSWQFPTPWEGRQPPCSAHHLLHTARCCCGILLQTCKFPHPLCRWCLCQWLFLSFLSWTNAGQQQPHQYSLSTSHPTLNTYKAGLKFYLITFLSGDKMIFNFQPEIYQLCCQQPVEPCCVKYSLGWGDSHS